MQLQRFWVFLFSLLLAFCSLYYEYAYAQVLSICLGGTKSQFLLVISIFTTALGVGSLLHKHFAQQTPLRNLLLKVEILLSILGGLGPFLLAWLLFPGNDGIGITQIVLSYLIVFAIGLLSGLEIPSLFAMLKNSQGAILAFDYFGMLLASILFPFYILPLLGTAAGTLFVSNLNFIAIIWLSPVKAGSKFLLGGLNLLVFILIILNTDELNELLSSIYLGGP